MPRKFGTYQFGPFLLEAGEHRLLRDGVEINLQLKAFETLCFLVENPGRLLTKDDLLGQVWPDTMVEENNLNKIISVLRKALGVCPKGESYIETVPRVGYRFNAKVAEITPGPRLAISSSRNSAALERPGNRQPEAGLREEELAKNGLPQEKSLAVLYFENLSGNKEDEYFRDGMTEDVITELEKIHGLRLFPRSCVLPYRDTPLPVTEVGQRLRAAYVLEGSIRRSGDCLRITARLAETRTGHSVWTERYDRRLEDVFAIQDEIAQSIALALRVVLTEKEKSEIKKVPTHNIQAYDYCLRGRQFFYQLRRQSLEYARQMFARAIVIDPEYARAYAGVADCCSFLYMWYDASEANLLEAVSASRRAVELDPQAAEAHASLGLAEFLGRNYEEARNEFETALALDNEQFEAYYFYGRCCFCQGEYEKAAQLFARASEVNPGDYQAPSSRALCLRALGRLEDAEEASREALEKVEQHLQLHPDDVRAVSLGSCSLHALGDRVRAFEWTNRALGMDPEQVPVLYNAACTYAMLDQPEKAIDCLEKAVQLGFGHLEWMEHDSDLAPVRAHPRFKALVLGLEADRGSLTA